MWEELDALCAEIGMVRSVKQPEGSFTAAQYARRSGLHPSSASIRLQRLQKQGKIEYLGQGLNNEKYFRIKK